MSFMISGVVWSAAGCADLGRIEHVTILVWFFHISLLWMEKVYGVKVGRGHKDKITQCHFFLSDSVLCHVIGHMLEGIRTHFCGISCLGKVNQEHGGGNSSKSWSACYGTHRLIITAWICLKESTLSFIQRAAWRTLPILQASP